MRYAIFLVLVFAGNLVIGQETKTKIYDPEANAREDLKGAIKEAQKGGKHVFVQVGGNWCGWCIKFHKLMNEDSELNTLFNSYYVGVKVNYSPEVKNLDILEEFGFPQRFGFPVFIILDEEGNRLHTQDTGLLEDGLGYDKRKLMQFFRSWSKTALDPDIYRD